MKPLHNIIKAGYPEMFLLCGEKYESSEFGYASEFVLDIDFRAYLKMLIKDAYKAYNYLFFPQPKIHKMSVLKIHQ